MQVVDSNKQKLTTPEIVIQTMETKTDTKNDYKTIKNLCLTYKSS